jgi:hypothetical protein
MTVRLKRDKFLRIACDQTRQMSKCFNGLHTFGSIDHISGSAYNRVRAIIMITCGIETQHYVKLSRFDTFA